MTVRIAAMTDAHQFAVLTIYQAGIDEGNATFETEAPTWDSFRAGKHHHLSFVAFLDTDPESVVGWIAAGPVSARSCYAGVIEHSVYVHPDVRGQGVAGALLLALVAEADASAVWTIQSSIFPENVASAALHTAAGFRTVGTREAIAQHHGRWRDTVLIERRKTRDHPDPLGTRDSLPHGR